MGLWRRRPTSRRKTLLAVATLRAALVAALADQTPTALAGGTGYHILKLTVTVNARPGLARAAWTSWRKRG